MRGLATRLTGDRGLDVNLRSAPQLKEYDAIVERIARDTSGPLLDWGCGWGQVSDRLRSAGVDTVSFEYMPEAEGPGTFHLEKFPHIEAHCSPHPVALPFEENSFNAVLSLGVLEHVADPGGSLDEIHRILRKSGILYVYKLPNKSSYLERIAKIMGMYYHGAEEHDRVYSKRSAIDLLEEHGFRVQEFRYANMLPLTLSGGLATRLGGSIWGLSRLLERVPMLNLLATNLELIAVAE